MDTFLKQRCEMQKKLNISQSMFNALIHVKQNSIIHFLRISQCKDTSDFLKWRMELFKVLLKCIQLFMGNTFSSLNWLFIVKEINESSHKICRHLLVNQTNKTCQCIIVSALMY